MKKAVTFLIILLLCSISCSDDTVSDDTDNDSNDRIIGTWALRAQTNSNTALELSACEQMTSIVFAADKSTETQRFSEVNGDCTLASSSSSTWQFEIGSVYEFALPGQSKLNHDVDFISTNRFRVIYTVGNATISQTYQRQL